MSLNIKVNSVFLLLVVVRSAEDKGVKKKLLQGQQMTTVLKNL